MLHLAHRHLDTSICFFPSRLLGITSGGSRASLILCSRLVISHILICFPRRRVTVRFVMGLLTFIIIEDSSSDPVSLFLRHFLQKLFLKYLDTIDLLRTRRVTVETFVTSMSETCLPPS